MTISILPSLPAALSNSRLAAVLLDDDTEVPASAMYRGGIAMTQYGQLYLCETPSGGAAPQDVYHLRGLKVRGDGAIVIAVGGTPARYRFGLALTESGEVCASTDAPTQFPNGVGTTATGLISVAYDSTNPSVTITGPTSSATYTADIGTTTLVISGTASDAVGLQSVVVVNTSDGDASYPATGLTSWTATIDVLDGENVITVTATDTSGNTATDTITVTVTVAGLDFSQVSLLLHAEGANGGTVHTDSSSYAHTMSAAGGNCPTVTVEKKYGSTSFSYGSAESLSTPNATEFDMSTGDFTLEGWYYATTGLIGILEIDLFTKNKTAPYPWRVYVPTTKKLTADGTDADSNVVFSFVDSVDFPMDQWVHIALVRSGNNFMLFKNGVQVSTTDVSAATLAVNTTAVVIGGPTPGVANWFGYIDEVRIAKGFAVYTANFTPPTGAFPDA